MQATRGAKALPINSIQDLQTAGQELAKSKMMGSINPSQGFFIACVCHQTGQSYNEYAETYHIVGDRPSMRADAMLAKLLDLGGEYKILERTSEKASVSMSYRNASGTFEVTAEEMYGEPVVYEGKPKDQRQQLEKPFEQRKLKDKYATPRSRKQMLWARLISDAVRVVCPQANRGQYTPEEVEDFPDESPAPTKNNDPVPLETTPAPDPAICPVAGPMLGRRWDDMDTETLQYAWNNLQDENMTDAHWEEIKKALNQKEQANG